MPSGDIRPLGLVAEGRYHYRFNGMHPVLCFVEDDGMS